MIAWLCVGTLAAGMGGVGTVHAKSGPRLKAASNARSFGLGIVLGEPTGLTFQATLGNHRAIAGGVAYSFGQTFLFFSDFQWFQKGMLGQPNRFVSELTPYLGVGGILTFFGNSSQGLRSGGGASLGLRVPLGLEWKPRGPSIRVYLELVPGIWLAPGVSPLVQGGIGARYHFGG